MVVADLGMGGGHTAGIRDVIQGDGSGSSSFWSGNVGNDSPHGPGPGRVSEKDGKTDHREAALAAPGSKLGVSPIGGGNAGGGFLGGGGVCTDKG